MPTEKAWYKLDTAAIIYPAVSNDRNTNVYRLSCYLTETINPEILSKALKLAMTSFPYFQVIMRRGFFWYYLEETSLEPEIEMELDRPCKRIFYNSKKELLFRVTYFGSRINLEGFHAIADGGGANDLLRTIVYHYLVLSFPEKFSKNPPHFKPTASPCEQSEDGFSRHYLPKPTHLKKNPKSYNLTGVSLPSNSIQVIHASVSTKKMLELAKSKGATITAYTTALMFCAIYEEQVPSRLSDRPLIISVPVDFRKLFPSKTTRNFFGLVEILYNFDGNPANFDDVLRSVSAQIIEKTTLENLTTLISNNMSLQKNLIARLIPLALKNIILNFFYRMNEKSVVTVVSNMGRVTMPDEFIGLIDKFSCMLNPTPIHKVKLTIISYLDSLDFCFTSTIEERKIQRYFIRHLTKNGVEVTLVSNGGDY